MKRCYACIVTLALLMLACNDGSVQTAEEKKSDDVMQKLGSLGYVNFVPVVKSEELKSGVTLYKRVLSYDGFNLFNSLGQFSASLIDMDGRVVHYWASDITGRAYERMRERFPQYLLPSHVSWGHIEMAENGDLVVIGYNHMLAKIGWHSSLIWKLDISAHHDVHVLKNGDIVCLTDRLRRIEVDNKPTLFLDNEIVFVTANGEIKRSISVFDALDGTMYRERLKEKMAVINHHPFP